MNGDSKRKIEFTRYYQSAPTLLDLAPEALEFFTRHGLQGFVELDWKAFPDVDDAVEFVDNFDRARMETTVRGECLPLGDECISDVFKLSAGVCSMPHEAKVRPYCSESCSAMLDSKCPNVHANGFFMTDSPGVWTERYRFLLYEFVLRRTKGDIPQLFVEWIEGHCGNHNWLGAFQHFFYSELIRIQGRTDLGLFPPSTAGPHIGLILAYYKSRRPRAVSVDATLPMTIDLQDHKTTVPIQAGTEPGFAHELVPTMETCIAAAKELEEENRRLRARLEEHGVYETHHDSRVTLRETEAESPKRKRMKQETAGEPHKGEVIKPPSQSEQNAPAASMP